MSTRRSRCALSDMCGSLQRGSRDRNRWPATCAQGWETSHITFKPFKNRFCLSREHVRRSGARLRLRSARKEEVASRHPTARRRLPPPKPCASGRKSFSTRRSAPKTARRSAGPSAMEPATRRSERVRSPEAQKHAPFIDGNNFAVPSRWKQRGPTNRNAGVIFQGHGCSADFRACRDCLDPPGGNCICLCSNNVV